MADDKPKSAGAMQVDTELVRTLAEMLAANDLNEIEVEDGERKIKVVRHREIPSYSGFVGSEFVAPAAAMSPPAAATGPSAETIPAAPAGESVKSPMVGTAFLSAEPGGKPFVAPGDTVKAGDTLLIVEAMKVMNPILAPKAGIVRQLLVADAQPVEYDQPLVVVE
jgi:acetyl-CoA carboxylase biotin carboxyl carrier protein